MKSDEKSHFQKIRNCAPFEALWGGSGKVTICLELAKFAFRVLWRPLNGSRVPEIDSNLSWAVEGTIWGPFQDYLNHSGPLEDSEAMSGADFDVPFPSLQTWSRFCGSKWLVHVSDT